MKSLRSIGIAALVAFSLNIAGQNANAADAKDIVAVASANGSFKTLVAAVQDAGLGDTLSGPGRFIWMYAPRDLFIFLPSANADSARSHCAHFTSHGCLQSRMG